QPAALTSDAILKPGATIRTGENGRALVVRGADTMLISGNSVVGIPGDTKEGLWTRILHQAGSILFNVEKRKVQHFEVSTPYLAAVVKGTQFRVTVADNGGHVDVLRGEVEVTDYKSGQYALVRSNQAARVSLQGPVGLSLSGSGTLSPIQHGTPGGSSVRPMTIPGERASAPAPGERTSASEPGERTSAPEPSERSSAPEPGERTSAPDRTDGQPSTPVLERHAQSAPAPSHGTSEEYGWISGIVARGANILGLNGGKSRDDATPVMFTLPAFIGLSVAVGTGVLRQRRRNKQKRGGR